MQTQSQIRKLGPGFLLAVLICLLFILAGAPAAVPQAKKPLSAENIMELLSGGVDTSRVTYLVLDRGVDFELTPKLEKAFQDAGADPTLMAAIRKSGPSAPRTTTSEIQPNPPAHSKPAPIIAHPETSRVPSIAPPPPQSTTGLIIRSQPGGVAIYIDDELKGETDPQEGVLKVTGLKPGKHHLRATLQGYEDVEGPAEVVAGRLEEIPVTLARAEAPPPPTVAELPAGKKFLVRHMHRAVEGVPGPAFCQGWMIVNVGYVRYISTDSPHKYMMGSSEIREVKQGSGGGGLSIKLDFGRKYDFVAVDEKGNEVSSGPVVNEIRYSMGQ